MRLPYNKIVVKIGTSTITGRTNSIDYPGLIDFMRQISYLWDQGVSVTLVSSGAIAVGKDALNFPHLSKHIPKKQMLFAVGQPRLMAVYNKILRMYGHNAAEILLTRNDFVQRANYLNARNTLNALLDQKVIPIINENDAVSINEMKLGDNDTLSALVSGLIGANLLILVTDQDGLFTANPNQDPNAELIPLIDTPEIPESVREAAGGSVSGLGTGGMATKVHAADIARRMGTAVVIVNGQKPDILIKAAEGKAGGTLFQPVNSVLESRKRFIMTDYHAGENAVIIDDGAAKAIISGKSLLPAGIRSFTGTFDRGDTIRILGTDMHEVGIGVTNYSSENLAGMAGCKASQIETILGYTYGDEVIHHDFMILN